MKAETLLPLGKLDPGLAEPEVPLDLNAPPNPGGMILSGSTWCFQAWFTDGTTSNFTDGLSITFQ